MLVGGVLTFKESQKLPTKAKHPQFFLEICNNALKNVSTQDFSFTVKLYVKVWKNPQRTSLGKRVTLGSNTLKNQCLTSRKIT